MFTTEHRSRESQYIKISEEKYRNLYNKLVISQ